MNRFLTRSRLTDLACRVATAALFLLLLPIILIAACHPKVDRLAARASPARDAKPT